MESTKVEISDTLVTLVLDVSLSMEFFNFGVKRYKELNTQLKKFIQTLTKSTKLIKIKRFVFALGAIHTGDFLLTENNKDEVYQKIKIHKKEITKCTSLYDAIHQGIESTEIESSKKKVVVIFSDGQDTTSNFTEIETVERIRSFSDKEGSLFTIIGFRLNWLKLEKDNVKAISFALDPKAPDVQTDGSQLSGSTSAYDDEESLDILKQYEEGNIGTVSMQEAISSGLTYVTNFTTE